MFLFRLVIFLFLLNIFSKAIADTVTVSADKNQSSDTSVQQNIDTDDVSLTVSGNAQVDDDSKAVLVDSGVEGASGNVKYVPDSSLYIRYKAEAAKGKNYNDFKR